jgi:hypothetical protein
MKTKPTLTAIIYTNCLIIFLLFSCAHSLYYKHWPLALITMIIIFAAIFLGYPKVEVRVEHYKLRHLLDNAGPKLESTYPGSSFHLNGVQMIIYEETFADNDKDGLGLPIAITVAPAQWPDQKVKVSYPSLLPFGGEEEIWNRRRLSMIYSKYNGQES